MVIKLHTKENVDNLLRLRHLRYRQTPNYLQRVKAHAIWRELQLSFLIVSVNWRFSDDKNLKADIHPICPFSVIFLSAHRHHRFLGFNNYYSQTAIAQETLFVSIQVVEGCI